MQQTHERSRFEKLIGYLAIPHELLHVAGYWLAGRRCHYQWGNLFVRPIGPMVLRVRLVGLLFPFIVFSSLFLVCAVRSGQAYADLLGGKGINNGYNQK